MGSNTLKCLFWSKTDKWNSLDSCFVYDRIKGARCTALFLYNGCLYFMHACYNSCWLRPEY